MSTLITTDGNSARTAATNDAVRSISSSVLTSVPGAAFTPPMSTISAPSATTERTRSSATSKAKVAPRS